MATALLVLLTVVLVLIGCLLYALKMEGWAQLCWVFASGTAGGAIVMYLETRTRP